MIELDEKIAKAKRKKEIEKQLREKGRADLMQIYGLTPEKQAQIQVDPEDLSFKYIPGKRPVEEGGNYEETES